MHILCLGLNHRTAEVSLRERLAFSVEEARAALARLGCCPESQLGSVSEMVLLSTCNRVEIYAAAAQLDFIHLEGFLADAKNVMVEDLAPHLYFLADQEAVDHLFRVSTGLDSLVLGEPQILGQVMKAFELARSQAAAGPVLSRLFQAALHTGKRARTETSIGSNPASISSVAVHLAEQVVHSLPRAQVVMVGAGEMAELAVEALRKRGVNHILVVNRTLERASSLASRWGGEASTFEQLPEAIGQADILISSTGAPHTVIHLEHILPGISQRPERSLIIIDIAVPRDVDVEVGKIPGVHLFDIDTLQKRLALSLAKRTNQVPLVETILEEEIAAFMGYIRALDVLPLIAELREQAEAIRQAELEKTLRRLADLTPEERQRLEVMTEALVKKLLHAPIARLRAEAGTPLAAEYAAAARSLFGLG